MSGLSGGRARHPVAPISPSPIGIHDHHREFPATRKSIRFGDAGIVGDGVTLNTDAIQRAIDRCAAVGGGTLTLPAGRYLTGTIELRSNVRLHLAEGAVLLGSPEPQHYRNLDPFIDAVGQSRGHALIVAVEADNVAIEGRGTIDGQGPKLKASQTPYVMRPFLVRWVRCTRVTVKDVHLTNPGAWTLNLYRTEDALIERVTIRNRGSEIHNADGINIDSSATVRIRDCDVITGDDAIVIKSTGGTPSRDITVSGCRLSTGANGIKLGTESFGGFENITVSNCRVFDTGMAGIALYTVDGGNLHKVTISDIELDGVNVAISIRLGARLKTFRNGDTANPAPGHLRDVTIRNVRARYIGMIGILINGVPGHPIESLTLENIDLTLPGRGPAAASSVELPENEQDYPEYDMFGRIMPAYGMYVRHARHLTLDGIKMHLEQPDARPPVVLVDVDDVTQENHTQHRGVPSSPSPSDGLRHKTRPLVPAKMASSCQPASDPGT